MTWITSALRRPTALVAVLALLAGVGLAACGDDSGDGAADGDASGQDSAISVADAWARSSPVVATAGAVYMVITNDGDGDDALLSAAVSTEVAEITEVHETRAAEGGMGEGGMGEDDMGDDDGDMSGESGDDDSTSSSMPMMEMVPVDRIELPAGGTIVMEPGGYHVMLLDLVEPLEDGDELEITLTFEVAGEVTVVAVVGDGPG